MSTDDGGAWHFLQSDIWGRFKAEFGWTPLRVRAPVVAGDTAGILTLTRRVGAGAHFTYVPYAPATGQGPVPILGVDNQADLSEIAGEISGAVRRELGLRPVCVRFDLPCDHDRITLSRPWRKARTDVQPRTTVILDLTRDDHALLEAMHKKHRYNIRLSEKHNVTVREIGAAGVAAWYELYRQTALRDRIAIHSREYYETLFRLSADDPDLTVKLYVAEHEGDLLAGIVVTHYRGGATYLYGASGNEKRNLMPNYALQWFAIRSAREAGCAWYDLFGIAPPGEGNHSMQGLTRVKTGFGGNVVERAGSWDFPVSSPGYMVFRNGEAARDIYFHRIRRAGH